MGDKNIKFVVVPNRNSWKHSPYSWFNMIKTLLIANLVHWISRFLFRMLTVMFTTGFAFVATNLTFTHAFIDHIFLKQYLEDGIGPSYVTKFLAGVIIFVLTVRITDTAVKRHPSIETFPWFFTLSLFFDGLILIIFKLYEDWLFLSIGDFAETAAIAIPLIIVIIIERKKLHKYRF